MDESKVSCRWQRVWDRHPGWLITLGISTVFAHGSGGGLAAYPQAMSVMDDFGTLVIPGDGWR